MLPDAIRCFKSPLSDGGRLACRTPGASPSGVDANRGIERVVAAAGTDADVLAVILYGSHARAEAQPGSDVDLCLVLTPARRDAAEVGRILLGYASLGDVDVQVFQRLPLYVRRRVLKEGRVLFVRDEDALYEEAFRTVRAWELFRPRYEAYLAEVARGGS